MTRRMAATRAADAKQSARLRALLLASLLATVGMYALGVGFIYAGGVFAPLSDVGAMVAALLLLAVAEEISRVVAPAAPRLNRLTHMLGRTAMGITAGASGALVVLDAGGWHRLAAVALRAQLGAGLLQGGWFAMVGALTIRTTRWRTPVAAAALITGAGYATGSVLALQGDLTSPAITASFAASALGFAGWALMISATESGARREHTSTSPRPGRAA